MHLKAKADGKLPESELALIQKIIETINHLTKTVDQVMNFARPAQLAPRPHDLNQIVRDVLQLAVHAGGGLLVLLAATALSVYKP
jgi:nitrogen fixation/metabolism regulation signal transduction histidine kinase